MFDVVVCGSLHYDIVVDAPRLPQSDETLPGTGWWPVMGGKGRNQAAVAALLSAKTAMIGRVGDDDFGARLVTDLEAAGVNISEIARDPETGSGMSVAIVDKDGEYGAIIVSAANLGLTPETVDRSIARIGVGTVAILQNESPAAASRAFAAAAQAGGAIVIHNAAPARAGYEDLVDFADVLVVNRVEAAMLTGLLVASPDDALRAAETLTRQTPRLQAVIVTLGGEGFVLAEGGLSAHRAVPRVDVVSTHGAGDAFTGALGTALSRGASHSEAADFAARVAARFVATPLEDRTGLDWSEYS